MKRRNAIKNTALATGGLLLAGPAANTFSNEYGVSRFEMVKKTKFGVQLFTIPRLVDADLPGTLKLISEIGYQDVEFFGPYPFSANETIQQWEGLKQQMGLKNNAFYGYSTKETILMLKEFKLRAPSFHADIITMRTGMNQMLDEFSGFKAKYIVLPALFSGRSTLDDYKKLADEFNGFGEQMSKYGMKFVYHNHGYEHKEMSGSVPMNYLIENTDERYVQFELDIFWMQAAGTNPLEFLKAYPTRYKMLHIKDASQHFRFAGDGGTPDQWMAGFPLMSDPGDGVFDIQAILAQAREGAVEHYFLERDLAPEPQVTLRNSYGNLVGMID